jgi:hypothetical protein
MTTTRVLWHVDPPLGNDLETKKQQPFLDSGQSDNELAGNRVFSSRSMPMARHATMDITMTGNVFYAVRATRVQFKKSQAVSLKGLAPKRNYWR